MDYPTAQSSASQRAWGLARWQYGAIGNAQLLALGFERQAIKHRLARGRLHRTRWRGVYAVGRPELDRLGLWMGALIAAGDGAGISHSSAVALWEMGSPAEAVIEVSVPHPRSPRLPDIRAHRRNALSPGGLTVCKHIPVTTPIQTIIDIAPSSTPAALERAINEADKRDLVDPETLRAALTEHAGEPGVAVVRDLLDRRTFTLTDSELERRFLPLAREAGLPPPRTQARVNGFRVDFLWPDLGLVVETDGLRYHRTPAQQAADRRRDQAHAAAGLTPLRFTRAQVALEPAHVVATLRRVARRLGASR